MPKQIGVDASAVIKNLNLMKREVRAAAAKGLAEAGMQLMNDAVMEEPTVPLKEGVLRASGSVHLDGNLIGTSEALGRDGTPADEVEEPTVAGGMRAVVGYNTPYAARLHEGVDFTFSESGAGAKFLETALDEHGEEYMAHVAEVIKDEALG